MPTLPERILEHLQANGPDFPTGISQALGARDSAVSGALTSLCRRELVDLSHEEPAAGGSGHPRRYYCAVGYEDPAAVPTSDERLPDSGPETLLAHMDAEIRMLRAAYPRADTEAIFYGNGGAMASGRRVA